MTTHRAAPLKWSVDWNNLGQWDKIMKGFPLLGPERRIHADILRQLKARSAQDFHVWEELGPEICSAARDTNKILIKQLGWPKAAVFLPDDPADIPFWDYGDGLATVEALMALEEHFGVTLPEDSWASIAKITFGNVIARLVGARKPEAGMGLNDVTPLPP